MFIQRNVQSNQKVWCKTGFFYGFIIKWVRSKKEIERFQPLLPLNPLKGKWLKIRTPFSPDVNIGRGSFWFSIIFIIRLFRSDSLNKTEKHSPGARKKRRFQNLLKTPPSPQVILYFRFLVLISNHRIIGYGCIYIHIDFMRGLLEIPGTIQTMFYLIKTRDGPSW